MSLSRARITMSHILVSGILQRETIVKVRRLPIEYSALTNDSDFIHMGFGGDSYNEAVALKALGDRVDFFSMIGEADYASLINTPAKLFEIDTNYILPKLSETPSAVIFYAPNKKQQIFEDKKDVRDAQYNVNLFKGKLQTADLLLSANANFCRPLIAEALSAGKKIAINIRNFDYATVKYNSYFLESADIMYLSDDNLDKDPYDFLKEVVEAYSPEVVILGQGAEGLIIYSKNTETYVHYNSVKTSTVVNTVGAGNALFASFLHYYLKTGDATLSIQNALLFASYKIGFLGSSNGFLTEEEIEHWRSLIW